MTADQVLDIRRAAELMRRRAHDATPGPWEMHADQAARWSVRQVHEYEHRPLADEFDPGDAKHIASWHPGVALAVADWLDHEAETATTIGTNYVDVEVAFGNALAVARAYLGGAS